MTPMAHSGHRQRRVGVLAVCAGVAVLAAAPVAAAPQAESEPVLSAVRSLDLVGTVPEVGGVAVTRFFAFADGTSEEDLRVEVQHLNATTRYELLIDDARAAAIVTDAAGAASVLLASPVVPGAQAIPALLFPVNGVDSIVIRDAAGRVVLRGDFAKAVRRQRVLGDDGRLSD